MVYRERRDELWTSQFTLIELLLVAYREQRDSERVVTNAANLVEVRGDVETIVAAATYVEDHEFTPFDALYLVDPTGALSSPATIRTRERYLVSIRRQSMRSDAPKPLTAFPTFLPAMDWTEEFRFSTTTLEHRTFEYPSKIL